MAIYYSGNCFNLIFFGTYGKSILDRFNKYVNLLILDLMKNLDYRRQTRAYFMLDSIWSYSILWIFFTHLIKLTWEMNLQIHFISISFQAKRIFEKHKILLQKCLTYLLDTTPSKVSSHSWLNDCPRGDKNQQIFVLVKVLFSS